MRVRQWPARSAGSRRLFPWVALGDFTAVTQRYLAHFVGCLGLIVSPSSSR